MPLDTSSPNTPDTAEASTFMTTENLYALGAHKPMMQRYLPIYIGNPQ
jgi:hypothetical protein